MFKLDENQKYKSFDFFFTGFGLRCFDFYCELSFYDWGCYIDVDWTKRVDEG